MKIVLINTVGETGSTGKICASLYHLAELKGAKPYIAYGRGKLSSKYRGYKIGNKFDFYCHVLRNFIFGDNGFGSYINTHKFIQWLKKEKPDIIHLHNIHGFYLNVELLFSYLKKYNIRVIWTLHDCWSFTGHCAHFDYIKCNKWKLQCEHCPQYRNTYPYSLLCDNTHDSYLRKKKAFTGVPNLTIVTPSYWLSSLVKHSFLKEYDTIVIPNGISLDSFTLPSISNATKPKIILGVANVWTSKKGLQYFIQLADILPKSYKIELVGLSHKQVLFFQKNYPNKVLPIQHTNNLQELVTLYQNAFAFVNPTLEDTFPTTNLEALACGTPVITFATGGSPESIDDTCGIVVPKGNLDSLYNAIISLDYNKKITQHSCWVKAQNYSDKICFQSYIDLYLTK